VSSLAKKAATESVKAASEALKAPSMTLFTPSVKVKSAVDDEKSVIHAPLNGNGGGKSVSCGAFDVARQCQKRHRWHFKRQR